MHEMRSTLDMGASRSPLPAWAHSLHLALGGTKTSQILWRSVCGKEKGVDACSCPQGHVVTQTAAPSMGSACV